MRECGPCTVCCTAVGVKELGKPFNTPCTKLHNAPAVGCTIYRKRPDSCHGYQCAWLTGFFEYKDRPDRVGAVFHPSEGDDGSARSLWITVFFTREDVDLARIRLMAKEMLLTPGVKGVRYVRHDQVLNAEFPINLKTYPGGENVGEGSSWLVYGESKEMFLDASRRIPLKVL